MSNNEKETGNHLIFFTTLKIVMQHRINRLADQTLIIQHLINLAKFYENGTTIYFCTK